MNPKTRFHEFPVLRMYMTPLPHTVGRGQPLSVAAAFMRQHEVRHLPVLDGGQIVGIVSARDVLLVESIPGTNPTVLLVEEAMSPDVFVAAPDTPLAEAVQTMVKRKLGSVVVVEHEKVVGVFTTIDALQALLDSLGDRT